MAPADQDLPSSPAAVPQFSSFLTTTLTLLGVAIGLGNVWRFPYMMGSYGGSAFLALFIVLMLIVAVPALVAELALARTYRGATITVLRRSFGMPGRVLGYLLILGVLGAGSYYTLVVGNVFYSAWYVLVSGFNADNLADFNTRLTAPGLQYSVALGILWLALLVIDRGLKRGIERVSETFVPYFFLVMAYLVYVAVSQPGAMATLREFLRPDFSAIGIREVFAALGQCFFSAGLGATFILVYGKFLRSDTSLSRAAAVTALGDTGASILASLFIVPCVFLYGMEMNSGPRLLFETLPALLSQMDSGRLIGAVFLSALSLVAFLSVIAVFQVIIVGLEEELEHKPWFRRRRLLLVIGVAESLLMIYPTWHPGIIGTLDLVFGSGFMLVGGGLAVVAVTWSMQRPRAFREMFGSETPVFFTSLLFWWLRWIIPLTVGAILLSTLYDAFSG